MACPRPKAAAITISTCQSTSRRAEEGRVQRVMSISPAVTIAASKMVNKPNETVATSTPKMPSAINARS